MPMHTCRCYYGNVSIGKLVNISVYLTLYMRRCMHIWVDPHLRINMNAHVCLYICAYNAFICTLFSLEKIPLMSNCAMN